MKFAHTAKKKEVLMLDIRKRIYLAIEKFPGIHFRELQRKVGIASGNIEYHLDYLRKADLIKAEKINTNKRFYLLGLNDYERKILGILRQKNFRKIILKILYEKQVTHKTVVDYLQISPSSVTWYLNQLIDRGILEAYKKGREKFYQLKEQDELIKVIIAYKESFVDKLVDKFVEAWEQ